MTTHRSSSMKAQLRNGFPKTVSNLIENLKTITEDELDRLAEAGDIDLIHNVPFRPGLELPELPGGWSAIYTGKQYDGAEGIIILLPKAPWNRKLWNRGQIKKAIESGMTEFQAGLFMASRIKFKMEMMKTVGAVVNNARLLGVYRLWRHTFTKDENMRWEARNSIHDNLSPMRRRELQAVLREITQPTEEQVWAAQRLLDSIRPADEPILPVAESPAEVETTEEEVVEKPKSGKTDAQREASRLRWKRWKARRKQKLREQREAGEVIEGCAEQPDDEAESIEKTMEEVYQEKGPEGLVEELIRQNPEPVETGVNANPNADFDGDVVQEPVPENGYEQVDVPAPVEKKKATRKRRIDVTGSSE